MKKLRPLFILFVILVLPLITYWVLKQGEHRVKPLKILPIMVENPGGNPDSVYKTVGEFAFPSQTGDTITLDSVEGYIYVADCFFSTCKGICPKLAAGLERVQEAFKDAKDVKLLSISVDPEHDSVPVLRDYADQHAAIDHKWYFLTGNKSEIYEFANKEFFFSATKDDNEEIKFLHDNTLRLVDKEGRFRGKFYDGTNPQEVDSLIFHIRILQREYDQSK